MTDDEILEPYGIDAPGAVLCHFCDLRHLSGMDCPPVLPVGTEWDR